ncbi:MAG: hypothetical protein ACYC2G_00540 [Gemmatimonadaceae bacterium]
MVVLAAIIGCTGQPDVAGDGARPADGAPVAPTTGAVAAAGGTACVPAGAMITGGGLGGVRVGQPVAGLRELCPARDSVLTLGEGRAEQALVVDATDATDASPVVAIHTGGDRVTRVIVSSPGVTTPQSIGVGSTIGEVRRAYPRACVLVGEGRLVVAVAELPGLSLGTTADFGTLVTGGGAPPLAALPDTAHVSSLWAVGAGGGICPRSSAGGG